jgi:hypothetical protein
MLLPIQRFCVIPLLVCSSEIISEKYQMIGMLECFPKLDCMDMRDVNRRYTFTLFRIEFYSMYIIIQSLLTPCIQNTIIVFLYSVLVFFHWILTRKKHVQIRNMERQNPNLVRVLRRRSGDPKIHSLFVDLQMNPESVMICAKNRL